MISASQTGPHSILWRMALVATLLVVLWPVASFADSFKFNGNASAVQAHQLASSGKLKLIDIRQPSEWRQTGVGQSAHKISMHEAGFLARLEALVGGDRSQPIALICARGNRSTYLKQQLDANGFTNVTNVREGMLGSQFGPGWLRSNLPITR